MKNSWHNLATRIDALTLRERVFLFLSVIAVCVALADFLWVSPVRGGHLQLTRKLESEKVELQRLRDELTASAASPDPARLARAELARLNAEMAATNGDIAKLADSSASGTNLPQVLAQFLRRQGGLTLLRTSNIASEATAPVAAAAGRAGAADTPVRRGLELVVSGSYPDLLRYVQTLENALPNLRWGVMKLVAEQQPPELSLQVFLLGPQS